MSNVNMTTCQIFQKSYKYHTLKHSHQGDIQPDAVRYQHFLYYCYSDIEFDWRTILSKFDIDIVIPHYGATLVQTYLL